MIIDKINFTTAELNTGAATAKDVEASGMTTGYLHPRQYRTSSVQVANNSGAEIHFNLFTTNEYNTWQTQPELSDLIPIANSSSINISAIQGKIAKVVCSGVTGHSAGVDIVCIQDTP